MEPSASIRCRKVAFVALVAVLALACFAASTSTTLAQEAAPAPQGEGQPAEAKAARNLLTHIIVSAGWFFGPVMFGMSIVVVTLVVLAAMDLRMSNAIPPAFVDEFTELVNKRQFKQAFEVCKNDNSYLARVLTAGMARLQYGVDDSREAALNQSEAVRAGKEQMINYLAVMGTLGPLFGLLGTVYGMILAFMKIGEFGAPRPELLAGDIAAALVTTLLGVLIAAPAIFFHTFFRNRIIRMSNETSNLADDLLTQMYHNTRRTTQTAAADTRTTAAT
jgi:biopolymer transport protein ExbB